MGFSPDRNLEWEEFRAEYCSLCRDLSTTVSTINVIVRFLIFLFKRA